MKIIASLACLLLTTFTLSAFAGEAASNSCVAESDKISDPTERAAALASCAAELANPERVAKAKQQRKELLCDRNAKGMKLVDERKSEYLQRCYHENEARQQFEGWQREMATIRVPAGG